MAESWTWSPDSGTRPARSAPARICAVPGCGAWADAEIRGLALCRDCVELFARAYRIPIDPIAKEGKNAGGF